MTTPLDDAQSRDVEVELLRNPEVHKRYRRRAVVGGTVIGALLGAIAAGPFVNEWRNPVTSYFLAILTTSCLGALTGYLFREIIVGRLAAGPHVGATAASECGAQSSPGADGGSDGDGGD